MTTCDNLPTIDERFDNLLVCPQRVAAMVGRRSPGEVTFEESEQNNARRLLLHVEKVAIENKRLEAESEASFLDRVSQQLHSHILTALEQQVEDITSLFDHTVGQVDDQSQILDCLGTRAATISKLEPWVAGSPWLYDELIKVVNSPTFRRRDSKGRIIVVENLRTALSFLGIDNLRLLLPSLLIKRVMPQITDPYPQIKIKFSQYATGTALSARTLATFWQQKPYPAYVMGMLSNMGRCLVARLYFKLFEATHRKLLEDAQRKRERDLHDGLLKIRPSASYLIAMQEKFADAISADIFDHLALQRVPIRPALRGLVTGQPDEETPYYDILIRAREYSKVRMLYSQRFITTDEVKATLRPLAFPSGSLDALKAVDIFTLPLSADLTD